MTDSAAHGRRRALAWASTQQLAIEPQAMRQVIEIASREHVPDLDAVMARQGSRLVPGLDATMRHGVAVINVIGPIFRYANLFTQISGATSIEIAALELQAAIDNPRVRAILLNIDSPGGAVTGVSDFAQMVRSSSKPVVAFVSGTAASAAYWIASSAGWIVVSNTAILGCIGVVAQIRLDKDENLVEIVSSQSPNKRPNVATDEGRGIVQAMVDELASVFIDSVARYRNVRTADVVTKFGAGGVLIGRSAVRANMADQVGTFEQVLATFASGGYGPLVDLTNRVEAQAARTPDRSWADIYTDLALGGPASSIATPAPAPQQGPGAAAAWDKAVRALSSDPRGIATTDGRPS